MIHAGIVTYQPDLDRLAANLAGIVDQVDVVHIYDNGSSNVAGIRDLVGTSGTIRLLEGGENAGIAHALNCLGEAAGAAGATSLVTLDQDSVAPTGMVDELHRIADLHGAALVAPYIVDRNKMSERDYLALSLPEVDYFTQAARKGAITSGALMRLDAWRQVGRFDASFFIDYVDYDFNQRLLLSGHRIARANWTHLLHEVGRAQKTWLRVPRKDIDNRWRLETFFSFGHGVERCYYKARNRVLFTRKYGRRIGVTHEGAWQIPQQILLTVLFERKRRQKLMAFVTGTRDGLRTPLNE